MLRDRNTVCMVADHLGVSTKTLYRLIKKGDLPCMKIGTAVRLTREQVEAFELKCTIPAAQNGKKDNQ